jgi:hypothetical protein
MTKSAISDKFAKFASKTTKGEFDKARKQESMAGGCPLPVDTRGVCVISEITCTETKVKQDGTGGDPMVSIKLEVESPEDYRGKTLSGPGLMFVIKDGPNSTAADAWARMLDSLEGLGLPRDIRTNYSDFAEVLDWFFEEPRRAEYHVAKDTYTGNQSGKIVRAHAYVPESEVASAETPAKETAVAHDPDADYCTYLGKKHKIISFSQENDTYELEAIPTGRIRSGVPADKVTLED